MVYLKLNLLREDQTNLRQLILKKSKSRFYSFRKPTLYFPNCIRLLCLHSVSLK